MWIVSEGPWGCSYKRLRATMWMLEIEPGPLEEQPECLTAEPSLQSPSLFLSTGPNRLSA